MGKRNKKRPSSNCAGRSGILRDNPCADLLLPSLVIQIHCGRWFIPWCNMALLQVFCPVFNVWDSVGGNGDAVYVVEWLPTREWQKKSDRSDGTLSFSDLTLNEYPCRMVWNILTLVAGCNTCWKMGHCSFHLCNHHVVSRLWVLLQTVLSWTPTKHCLTSN